MKKTSITSGINIILAALLVFLLFFYEGTPSSNSASPNEPSSAVNQAEEIVSTSCTSCHGESLQGGSGPAIEKVGSKYDQGKIEDIINNGKGGMPAGVISKEEAAVVSEWLSQKK